MIVAPLMLFACLVAVNSERPAEGHGHDSCVCTRNEYFIEASFNRTCKQDLLREVKSTVDYIAVDVKQLKNLSVEIQQAITDLSVAQQTSTDELKVQIREGFEQVTEKIEENQQVIREESTTVIESQQSSIAYLKQVATDVIFCVFLADSKNELMQWRGVRNLVTGTFAPKNFRSLELSFPGTFAPWLSNN